MLCVAPVALEGFAHPGVGERLVAVGDNRIKVDPGALGGVIRALPGNRVVHHQSIGHAEYTASGRQLEYRLANHRRETARKETLVVAQFERLTTLGLLGGVTADDLQALFQVLLRRLNTLPAIHGTTGNALEDHDFAGTTGGQGWEREVLANSRNQVEGDP
ncbi:hypothetical protein D3C78_1128250 [compost metagenome]